MSQERLKTAGMHFFGGGGGGGEGGGINRVHHGLCENGEYTTCASYAVYKSFSDRFR